MSRQSKGNATVDTTAGGTDIVSANEKRNGIQFFNEGSVDVWLGFGEDPVVEEGIKIPANGAYTMHYGGEPAGYNKLGILAIKGIVSSGSAKVTYQEL